MGNKKKGKIILFLMRHGQTVLNKAEITQGWCDGDLTDEGAEAALNTALGLRDVKFKAVYSSDLGRAVKTAGIVIKENKASIKLQLKELKGLRELHFGKYEGQMEKVLINDIITYLNVSSFKEAAEKYDFQKEFCNTCAALDETKGAEDYDTVIKRVMNTLEEICIENLDNKAENVLIVAHGGIIRLIIDYLDKSFNVRSIDNLSISKVIYENGSFKVESVNDNSYCEKGQALKAGTI
ncbi:MAG: putative phosphoglycerate mutase family protein [Clostridiaceae bacterium]|jgi:probable phosphoglycerate mutase|nr:putative phosphoglycerate mutase family protein [Clostridiaceae bacterium]